RDGRDPGHRRDPRGRLSGGPARGAHSRGIPKRRANVLTTQLIYGGTGLILFLLGIWSFLVHPGLLRKLIAINVTGAGVFQLLVAVAYRGIDQPPDPVPQALVLTGIVVAVSATSLALALWQRLDGEDD
ncbi:MAG: cation:proton antiporter subunit C, partial [Chromatiaceae bacterium]